MNLDNKTLQVTYLEHSAWLVTKNDQAWLFDYGQLPKRQKALDLADLGQKQLSVFFSHLHQDHWQADLARQALDRPGSKVFLGITTPTEKPSGLPGLITMLPRTSYKDGQLTVLASGSTDQGVSFLVQQAGLLIYHGGDLAVWDNTAQYQDGYRQEIDWLAGQLGQAQPLLAFIPVSTSDGYQEEPLLAGISYFLRKIRPRYILPMHAHGYEQLYSSFASWLRGQPSDAELLQAKQAGDYFQLEGQDYVQDQA